MIELTQAVLKLKEALHQEIGKPYIEPIVKWLARKLERITKKGSTVD